MKRTRTAGPLAHSDTVVRTSHFSATHCKKALKASCSGYYVYTKVSQGSYGARGAAPTNRVGYIYNSKSPVARDLWSKNHSLSSGYRPRTRMVLDHKSMATGLLLIINNFCILILIISLLLHNQLCFLVH